MKMFLRVEQILKLLFFSLPFLYFVLYGFWGFSETDGCFIPALSYRVISGELPHQDFFYVRPALSPLFHSLELLLLPDNLEMIGLRLLAYLMMGGSVWLGLESLKSQFDFRALGVSPWLLGILAFAFSMHNFPPMPWHTLDGIFFAALGFFLLTRGPQMGYIAAGLVVMVLSACAKQPFAVSPVVGLAMLFVLYPLRDVLKGVALAAGIGGVLLGIFLLWDQDGTLRHAMWSQISSSSKTSDLKSGAVNMYIRPTLVWVIPVALFWVVMRYILRLQQTGKVMAITLLGGLSVWAAYQAYSIHVSQHFVAPRFGFYHALLAGAFMVIGMQMLQRKDFKAMALLGAMALVNWASGVSWGYSFPVLFCLPALMAIVYFIGEVNGYQVPRWGYAAAAGIVLVSFFAAHRYPYGDASRSDLTYHLGDVFPRLSHIYTNKTAYDKHVAFKALHIQYGNNFAVLPGFPLAHYLTQTMPTIQLDWEHDGELMFEVGTQAILARLDAQQTTVFVEKDAKSEAFLPPGNYKCSPLEHILNHWHKVDENAFFEVYAVQPADSAGRLAP
jgi:hypothetical protein